MSRLSDILGTLATGHWMLTGIHPLLHGNAYAVVRTGDMRPYGNILLVKGVVNAYPPAA